MKYLPLRIFLVILFDIPILLLKQHFDGFLLIVYGDKNNTVVSFNSLFAYLSVSQAMERVSCGKLRN